MNKKQRLALIIATLEDIMENEIYFDAILSIEKIKIIEILLNIKPHSRKSKQVEKRVISGRGLKYGRKKKS